MSAAASESMPQSGLSDEGVNVVRDIATDIAAVKENGIDPEQAVRFAAALVGAGTDEVKISPERGVPNKVRVSFNGQEYVMGRNQVNKLRKLSEAIQKDRTDKEAKDKESAERRSKIYDDIKKGVSAFGQSIVSPVPEEKQEENRQRQENIRRARGNMGAIPE